MTKKIAIFVLSLTIALAATIGIGVQHSANNEASQMTLCDLPYIRVSM